MNVTWHYSPVTVGILKLIDKAAEAFTVKPYIIMQNWYKYVLFLQANLASQEARLAAAMSDLNTAQGQLDAKQAELDAALALYNKAMAHTQVSSGD